MTSATCARLAAALAALGGLATSSRAQVVEPGVDKPCPAPQVVTWPGGSVTVNGPEVIVRQPGRTGRSTGVISGSGNGFGNTIVVDNGPGGGITVVQNSRNGVGNRLILGPDDELIELPRCTPKPAPADPVVLPKLPPADPVIEPPAAPVRPGDVPAPVAAAVIYKGKANPFWTKKAFSEAHDGNLYGSQADNAWFRYHAEDDAYRPVAGGP
jgi:hypothetical protein